MSAAFSLPQNMLWEYDLSTFNYDRSYLVVIERILERGTIGQWKMMLRYYGKEKISEAIEWSAQLQKRDKDFARHFINSDLLHD